jgi:hypothetical protein
MPRTALSTQLRHARALLPVRHRRTLTRSMHAQNAAAWGGDGAAGVVLSSSSISHFSPPHAVLVSCTSAHNANLPQAQVRARRHNAAAIGTGAPQRCQCGCVSRYKTKNDVWVRGRAGSAALSPSRGRRVTLLSPLYSGLVQVMRLNLMSPVSRPCVMSGMTSAPGGGGGRGRSSKTTHKQRFATLPRQRTLDGLGARLQQPKEALRSGAARGSAPA